MNIIALLKAGKPARTKSGFRAKFVAVIGGGEIPAPLIMEVFYENDILNGGYRKSHIPVMENYYTDGRFYSPYENHMDLVISDF